MKCSLSSVATRAVQKTCNSTRASSSCFGVTGLCSCGLDVALQDDPDAVPDPDPGGAADLPETVLATGVAAFTPKPRPKPKATG